MLRLLLNLIDLAVAGVPSSPREARLAALLVMAETVVAKTDEETGNWDWKGRSEAVEVTGEVLCVGSGFCCAFGTPFWGSLINPFFEDGANCCLQLVTLLSDGFSNQTSLTAQAESNAKRKVVSLDMLLPPLHSCNVLRQGGSKVLLWKSVRRTSMG